MNDTGAVLSALPLRALKPTECLSCCKFVTNPERVKKFVRDYIY